MNRKIMLAVLVVLSSWTGHSVWAEESVRGVAPETPLGQKKGLFFRLNPGMNLISKMDFINSSEITSLHVGAGIEYFYSPYVGNFIGADYEKRGFNSKISKGVNAKVRTGYLDIPVGVVFNTGGLWGNGQFRNQLKLGYFYAAKIENFKATINDQDTINGININDKINDVLKPKSFHGILVEAETLFPVSHSFSFGFNVWTKIGLTEAISIAKTKVLDMGDLEINTKTMDFGLGLVLGFN